MNIYNYRNKINTYFVWALDQKLSLNTMIHSIITYSQIYINKYNNKLMSVLRKFSHEQLIN